MRVQYSEHRQHGQSTPADEARMKPVEPPPIGRNIQAIRKKQALTLDMLSEKSGVSKAMLSQIESGKVNPTVATVWKIAQGLRVEINSLLEGSGGPRRIFTATAHEDITSLDTDEEGLHIKVLTPVTMVEDLEMYLLTFKPAGALRSAPHFPRTEEFVTVFRGHVRVSAGDNSSELREGDFIRYHCDVPHSIENLGRGEARIHMVVRFNRQGV
jgi:transcriptional regulator with XRE-family HTH domain